MELLYYIVNLSHLTRRDTYVTLWRSDCRGYAWPLIWAGKYAESEIRSHLDYYNDGLDNVAVPCAILDALAVAPKAGLIDRDAGPVVPSTENNWKQILAHVLTPTRYAVPVVYRGLPRHRPARVAKVA